MKKKTKKWNFNKGAGYCMKKKTKKRIAYMILITGYVIPLVVFFSFVIPVFIVNAKC